MSKKLPDCPVQLTLMVISNKWKIFIIQELLSGTKRFGELERSLEGISKKVLSDNLKEMIDDHLITRKVYPEVPPKVEYTLTEIGYSINILFDDMSIWAENYRNEIS